MIFLKGLASAFGAAGITTKLIAIGSLLLALTTGGAIVYHHIWSNGYERALTDIAKQDKKAVARATEHRRSFLDCRAAGRVWDQGTGKCAGG